MWSKMINKIKAFFKNTIDLSIAANLQNKNNELIQKLDDLNWKIQDITQSVRDSSSQQHRDMIDLIEEVKKK